MEGQAGSRHKSKSLLGSSNRISLSCSSPHRRARKLYQTFQAPGYFLVDVSVSRQHYELSEASFTSKKRLEIKFIGFVSSIIHG